MAHGQVLRARERGAPRPLRLLAGLLFGLAGLGACQPSVALAQAPGAGEVRSLPSAPEGVGPAALAPRATHRRLTVDGEEYWELRRGAPLTVEVPRAGTLTLLLRVHLPAGASPELRGQPTELLVELLEPPPARPLRRFRTRRPLDRRVRYGEVGRLRPSEEAIFGLEFSEAGLCRVSLSQGAPLGAVVGLRFIPVEPGAPPAPTGAELTLEELAGFSPPPASPPASPPDVRAASDLVALRVRSGAAVALAGGAEGNLLGGIAAQLRVASLWLGLDVDLFGVSYSGEAAASRGSDFETRLAYDAVPFLLTLRIDGRWLPFLAHVEAGLGVTWARETLSSLAGQLRTSEDLVLLGAALRAGLGLEVGAGALELQLGLRVHPALLSGEGQAQAPLGGMLEGLIGYRFGVL